MPQNAAAAPIGVFDSGVGGLTVYRALREALPHESATWGPDKSILSEASDPRFYLQA